MALIQCTQKLLAKLDSFDVGLMEETTSILGDWHANLLCIERRNCILFTNDLTLYSIFLPKIVKAHFQKLAEVFTQALALNLEAEALGQHIEPIFAEYKNKLIFTKSNNRSVLGSMNDIAYIVKLRVFDHGGLDHCDCLKLNKTINCTPFKAIKYYYPIECLTKLLMIQGEKRYD
ncbi:TPA: hypothetical protein DEO28_01690 [Candidatus Dependentiae bacterium]|nr:MAG: hypothetical protein UR14_C0004G0026 [candidate division TM6 bacterium GW2011_GWE2_31_21]KKP52944.1 MAG: hypothetical protein UR43_C0008G0026 [candidate division TM6 bacterium GW2011_GWF2_33_332]HBS47815.1 hypothetical protein [Candidatus Dependentiae bacterium]HBZ73209.1 hypothetical protein [Candidatus Dependentiae bacterium]